MSAAPSRYFPGRAPTEFHSDGSESEADPLNGPGPSAAAPTAQSHPPPAPSSRRRRIVARVVPPPPADKQEQPAAPRRGSTAGFVPVKISSSQPESHNSRAGRPPGSSASDSGSDYSSHSSSSAIPHSPDVARSATEKDDDDDEQVDDDIHTMRPVFLPASSRNFQNDVDIEAERAERAEEQRRLLRKQEAQRLVSQVLKDEQHRRDVHNDQLPDCEDKPEHRDADYALWKVREILRIQRDRDEQRAWEQRGSVGKHPDHLDPATADA